MPSALHVAGPGAPLAGFDALAQTIVHCDTAQQRSVGAGEEEVLFVLRGRGELELGTERHALQTESGAHLLAQETYTLHPQDGPLTVVSVRIPRAEPGRRERVVSRLEDQEAQAATTQREFRIVTAGLRAATHFVGYIPTARAPEHFHTYDEVIYVLDGVGVMHADGRHQPLRAGSAIQLPARTVHCLENTGSDVMRVVAVFRPAGSPAAAYYPDGTPAFAGVSPTPPKQEVTQ